MTDRPGLRSTGCSTGLLDWLRAEPQDVRSEAVAGDPVVAEAVGLPSWATLVRAPNPGPMTLDGTNTWLLRAPGQESCYVVDPGPRHEGHLRAVAAHGPVAGILLTHGHPDHVDGVDRFRELTGAEVVRDAPGIERIATPGHSSDSVCYRVELGDDPAVLTGDTILGRGTTVVAYPDGDLGHYLDSLTRLVGLGGIPVLTGHGPPLTDCAAAALLYLEHRKVRLDQVRAALVAGARSAREVVEIVYADVDRAVWPWAEMSVRAQLAYLARDAGAESPGGNVRWDTP